jgi:NAD(P)H-hydrate epimerase
VGVAVTQELAVQPGDLVVDALLGTGLSRQVEGEAAGWIEAVAAARPEAAVLAVDLPSGLHADTGQVMGVAVAADETLTLGLPKLGLLFEPGRTLAGRIKVGRIGIADPEPGGAGAELWTRAAAGAALPARPRAGHKGTFGHVLVIAGSEGMTGAAALAARGAGRSGAGLVTVACPESTNPALEALLAEAMTVPVAETAEHGLAPAARKRLLELAEARHAVVLGPGIGRGPETAALVRELAPEIPQPLVLDADGLHALEGAPAILKGRRAVTIVTPHPGEAAYLLGGTAGEIVADRPAAARALAAATGAIVLLKGAGTVIAEPEGRLAVNPTGGPALGTGGTGDVLAGGTGALLGQGVPAYEAAVLAAFVHGAAGDRVAAASGDAGLLAGDVVEALPATLAALRAGAGEAEMQGDVLAFPEP